MKRIRPTARDIGGNGQDGELNIMGENMSSQKSQTVSENTDMGKIEKQIESYVESGYIKNTFGRQLLVKEIKAFIRKALQDQKSRILQELTLEIPDYRTPVKDFNDGLLSGFRDAEQQLEEKKGIES